MSPFSSWQVSPYPPASSCARVNTLPRRKRSRVRRLRLHRPRRPSPRRLPLERPSPFRKCSRVRRLRLHNPQRQRSAPPAVGTSPSSPPAEKAVTAPAAQTEPPGEVVAEPEPTGAADAHAAQPELPDGGIILVARRPVEVLASPSSSSAALYGLPAGRPFRVIGREGGFAHIQDLKSSASGWIDEICARGAPARSGRLDFLPNRRPSQPAGSPQTRPPVRSRQQRRRTPRSLPTPTTPLNRTAAAPAYLVEGVFSAESSATATSLSVSDASRERGPE